MINKQGGTQYNNFLPFSPLAVYTGHLRFFGSFLFGFVRFSGVSKFHNFLHFFLYKKKHKWGSRSKHWQHRGVTASILDTVISLQCGKEKQKFALFS